VSVPSAAPRARKPRGQLAIVLHTHMPYVEGFGTWPFGEEWLWEAMASCYLPLLELLERDAPLTLSLTPVLCDQLEAPGVAERFTRFVGDVRRHTHEEDTLGLRRGGHETLARELERSWQDYERARLSFERRGGDLLAALAPYAQWTSAATHAVLPLLASDACARLQIETGIASHADRFAPRDHTSSNADLAHPHGGRVCAAGSRRGWRGGFWLPECAHVPALEPLLADAGVRSTCVELTRQFGLGAREHLQPLLGSGDVVLFGIDRATVSIVWSDAGYPADGTYRDYHRHTTHHHNPWRNDGGEYDYELAQTRAREHAADFVTRTRARLRRDGEGLPGGGLAVCALDTELLGHWWYEGLIWLEAVVEECTRQELELVRLDDVREIAEPASANSFQALGRSAGTASSWGENGDLSTWSGPAVAELAFATRVAELRTIRTAECGRVGPAAVRELLALQSSDWAFMISRDLAVPYARERFDGHLAAHARALEHGLHADPEGLRRLAPYADPAVLLAP
jgi:1,4-alpha-glucan branching enzyme